jgi:hypothetical protein
MTLSRRTVVAAAAALPFASAAARAVVPVTVRVDASKTLATIAPDYMGLGYEISSVAISGLLSARNDAYVKLVRDLGRQGVIRIGGNTSDFSRYDAHGVPVSAPKATVVNEANLHELKTFVDAIGWKLIWGLNLGDDKLDNAVEQARAVSTIMGDKLMALEIGNEPDLFPRSGHRGADYGYPAWFAEYRRYKAAIRAVLPHAPFAGPDLAGATDWMEQFARDDRDIALLTAHHYITGQANPAATLETMLANNTKYDPVQARFQAAAQSAGKPWRICETASFSGGGKEGVSDTFAASLWALDYLFVLAGHGCAGVNMETGVNHLGWISHYTPIGDDLKGHYSAAPEYYGLLAFALMSGHDLVAVDCQANGINLSAHAVYGDEIVYAVRGDPNTVHAAGKETWVTLINKDLHQDADVLITTGAPIKLFRPKLLRAPSAAATSGITLDWAADMGKGMIKREGPADLRVHVPATSAVLVWLGA